MTTPTEHCYIVTDSQILGGEPIVRGTRTPVRAVVEMWRLGMDPVEIPRILPHLNLAQVFDALSYYSDHQEQILGYIGSSPIPDELIDPPGESSQPLLSSPSGNHNNGEHGNTLKCL